MTVASGLAEFLVGQRIADLPQQTLDHAAMLVASTIASAACGRSLELSCIIRELAEERGGRADATVWFTGRKLPIADAAQVNAVMSDAAASDDSDLRNSVHAGTPLTAMSLAIAEQRWLGGDAMLRAMVLGYEAAGRISAAMPRFRERGFHGCYGAIFAATVASSLLLEADANRLVQAIAPSATSIGGLVVAAHLIGMAHSPAYFTAAGAADGTFSWQHASPGKIADPVIHRLIDLMRVGDPPKDDAAQFR